MGTEPRGDRVSLRFRRSKRVHPLLPPTNRTDAKTISGRIVKSAGIHKKPHGTTSGSSAFGQWSVAMNPTRDDVNITFAQHPLHADSVAAHNSRDLDRWANLYHRESMLLDSTGKQAA